MGFKSGYVDISNKIKGSTKPSTGDTYTATENCFMTMNLAASANSYTNVFLNGEIIIEAYSGGSVNQMPYLLPLKEGDVVTFSNVSHVATWYKVFGMV